MLGDIFGKRLKERRQNLGRTQVESASSLGVTQAYLSMLESGTNKPPILNLVREVAVLYGTTTDYLLGLTDNPSPCLQRDRLPPTVKKVASIMSEWNEHTRREFLGRAEEETERERQHRKLDSAQHTTFRPFLKACHRRKPKS